MCVLTTDPPFFIYVVAQFSGHEGTWVDTDGDAQVCNSSFILYFSVISIKLLLTRYCSETPKHSHLQRFDKQYYEEIYLNSWRPRNMGESNQDWTVGRSSDGGNIRMMLNTDICLVFDIDAYMDENVPCCTRTGAFYTDGEDSCVDVDAAARSCPMYSQFQDRWEARQAVGEMLGGDYPNTNNEPFYTAFTEAWGKATTVGQSNLSPLSDSCE